MMSTRNAILKTVFEIVEKNLKGLHAQIYLYGSWARNEERPTSDIDLAIWSDKPLPTGTLSKLRTALEEAPIPYPIEVVDLREADAVFRQQVLKEGIVWKDCNNV
jgi:predicted nucleotidyltransferase